ncbi:MAG: 2-hydroxyacid dehydrogenase [Acidimicrobiaceae bacterium]|nr:2-hydroxyacid dehydrogenase [Acidimicrobiaceae bacterium]
MTTPLVVSVPEEYLAEALRTLDPRVDVVLWDLSIPPPRDHIDVVVPDYLAPKAWLANAASVGARLIQSQSIGYDGVAPMLPPGSVYANAASVHETSTAELALTLILAAQRGLADFVRAADKCEWTFAFHESLADRTVLLLGYGGVGRAIESRLVPFEVEIVRVGHSARRIGDIDIHAGSELPALLAHADIVVVSLPLTEETTHLVDREFLSHMSDHSLLVNVGRGPLVDTDAMLFEATRGRLRFALDVVDPEPLPPDHPLFGLSNVLITPHVGGATSAMSPRIIKLITGQVQRLQRGEEPINVVLRT